MNGYRAIIEAQAHFGLPQPLPPIPQRSISDDPSREIISSEFSLQYPISGGSAVNVYGPEVLVASFQKPHAGVDVFIHLDSVAGAKTIGTPFEIAGCLYGITGNQRTPLARGAYSLRRSSASLLTFAQDLFLIAGRVSAEKFEVTLRAGGVNPAAAVNILGTLTGIGYDAPGFNQAASRARGSLGQGVLRRAQLLGFSGLNTGATALSIQAYDTVGVVANGSVPFAEFAISPSGKFSEFLADIPLEFLAGIQLLASSTLYQYTADATASVVSIEYA